MSNTDGKLPLPDLEKNGVTAPPTDVTAFAASESENPSRGAADLEAVFDVPVKVSAVLGRARMGRIAQAWSGSGARARPQGRRGDRHLRQ